MSNLAATQLVVPEIETRENEDSSKLWGSIHTQNPKMPNYEISEPEITIGRKDLCNIVIHDGRISSTHCRIFLKDVDTDYETALIEDLRFTILPFLNYHN